MFSAPVRWAYHTSKATFFNAHGLIAGTTLPRQTRASSRHIIQVQMTQGDFKRWLYRGQRPNWIARILNRVWASVASSGVASNYLETLEVTGRKSGRTISLPVVITIVDGQRYLVSMLGDNVNWVQNVRAAGGRAILRSGVREEVQLEEVPAEQRAPILRSYVQRASGARPHVPVNRDAAVAEFQRVAAAFPVFRVASAKTVQPT
jgi:hypothetical protein